MKSSKELTKPKIIIIKKNQITQKQTTSKKYVSMYLNKEFTRHWHRTSKKVFQITVYFTTIPGLEKLNQGYCQV